MVIDAATLVVEWAVLRVLFGAYFCDPWLLVRVLVTRGIEP